MNLCKVSTILNKPCRKLRYDMTLSKVSTISMKRVENLKIMNLSKVSKCNLLKIIPTWTQQPYKRQAWLVKIKKNDLSKVITIG